MGFVSPCRNNELRNALSKWTLCPTIGVSWSEFFLMKVLICEQAFDGGHAWRLCSSMFIPFTFRAWGFML